MPIAFFALAAILFVGCEPIAGNDGPNTEEPGDVNTNYDPNAELQVTTNKVEMGFGGGEGSVGYRLANLAEGFATTPKASVNANWVKITSIEEGKINFVVDLSLVAERRVATLVIEYGEQSHNVFIEQEEGMKADVEFVAKAINGQYDGTKYSIGHNYFVILSEKGTTGWGDLYVDTYYRLDLFSAVATASDAEKVILPNGVYTFDPLSVGTAGTFGYEYSVRLEPMSDGGLKNEYFDKGIVIVTDNRIEALLRIATADGSGKVHHVVYEGDLELGYIEIPEPDFYSTLTDDYTFNHPDGVLRLVNYGDYYGVGANNWSVSMLLPGGEPLNGDYFLLDIIADDLDNSSDAIVGTYTCVENEENVAKNTFVRGSKDGNEYLYSWYMVIVDNFIDHGQVAPLADGTITISKDDTDVKPKYTVAFDCIDDNGHKIKGSFTTSIVEEYQPQ